MNEKNGLDPGFGKRIKDRRKELNMTQRELAEKSGIAYRSIQDYESEKRTPKINARITLANALDIPYTDLFIPDRTPMSFDSPEAFKKAWNELSQDQDGVGESIHIGYGDRITNEVTYTFKQSGLSESEKNELVNYYNFLLYKRNNPTNSETEE